MSDSIHTRSSGVGLERSCKDGASDWLRTVDAAEGVELLAARFKGRAYQKHRHDSYSICLTTEGVQVFDYRGATEFSMTGQVVVLHPDEPHDGRAGTEECFGYRMVYLDPSLIFDAMPALCGRACPLPFVDPPVIDNDRLIAAVTGAFHNPAEPLALDNLLVELAEGLLQAAPDSGAILRPARLDEKALHRARQFLEEERTRVVRSSELEAVTGLTRYELARQFRLRHGTSPYRYLIMRRLDLARSLMARGLPLVRVALEAGFADQAHFSRMFKAAYGVAPARYGALRGGR